MRNMFWGRESCIPLLLIWACASASLVLKHIPAEIAEHYNRYYSNEGIRYTIANYGRVPYGKSIAGTLHIPRDRTGCSEIDHGASAPGNLIVLLQRGGCSFVSKTANAERAGAQLAIIMDNVLEDAQQVVMKDDGCGAAVNIPSVFISAEAGLMLSAAYDAAYNEERGASELEIAIDFATTKTEKVDVKIFISLHGEETGLLLEEMKQFMALADSAAIAITPFY